MEPKILYQELAGGAKRVALLVSGITSLLTAAPVLASACQSRL
jgi:hypothetical protein